MIDILEIYEELGWIFVPFFLFKIIWLFTKKEEKLNNIILVATITEMIGILILYLYTLLININGKYSGVMGLLGIIFCVDIFFLFFICIYMKRHIKNKENNYKTKNNKNKNLNYILTSLCSLCIMLFIIFSYIIPREFEIPNPFETEEEKIAKQNFLNYMNNRYGDRNFKVKDIAIKYQYSYSFTQLKPRKYKDGYSATIDSNNIPKKVELELDSTGRIVKDSLIDDYIDIYYAEEMKNIPINLEGTIYDETSHNKYHLNLKKYLSEKKIAKVQNDFYEKFNVIMEIKCDKYLRTEVPENFGHLPSKEELIDFCKLETDNIEIKINENKNLSTYEKSNYLRELANFTKEYFNTDDEIKMNYIWWEESGTINIKDGKITII